MHIPIPIPIGVQRVAAVQGTFWRFVDCAHCRQPFAFLVNLEATGADHDLLFLDKQGSEERARVTAEENLVKKSRNVVLPVPCPHCGCYQDDMSRELKDEASINAWQIAGVVLTLLSFVLLAFDIAYVWVLSIALAIVGLAVLTYGYVVAFHFDPNAGDPEPRKALGRKHAVWGERLSELLAVRSSAESVAASADRGASE